MAHLHEAKQRLRRRSLKGFTSFEAYSECFVQHIEIGGIPYKATCIFCTTALNCIGYEGFLTHIESAHSSDLMQLGLDIRWWPEHVQEGLDASTAMDLPLRELQLINRHGGEKAIVSAFYQKESDGKMLKCRFCTYKFRVTKGTSRKAELLLHLASSHMPHVPDCFRVNTQGQKGSTLQTIKMLFGLSSLGPDLTTGHMMCRHGGCGAAIKPLTSRGTRAVKLHLLKHLGDFDLHMDHPTEITQRSSFLHATFLQERNPGTADFNVCCPFCSADLDGVDVDRVCLVHALSCAVFDQDWLIRILEERVHIHHSRPALRTLIDIIISSKVMSRPDLSIRVRHFCQQRIDDDTAFVPAEPFGLLHFNDLFPCSTSMVTLEQLSARKFYYLECDGFSSEEVQIMARCVLHCLDLTETDDGSQASLVVYTTGVAGDAHSNQLLKRKFNLNFKADALFMSYEALYWIFGLFLDQTGASSASLAQTPSAVSEFLRQSHLWTTSLNNLPYSIPMFPLATNTDNLRSTFFGEAPNDQERKIRWICMRCSELFPTSKQLEDHVHECHAQELKWMRQLARVGWDHKRASFFDVSSDIPMIGGRPGSIVIVKCRFRYPHLCSKAKVVAKTAAGLLKYPDFSAVEYHAGYHLHRGMTPVCPFDYMDLSEPSRRSLAKIFPCDGSFSLKHVIFLNNFHLRPPFVGTYEYCMLMFNGEGVLLGKWIILTKERVAQIAVNENLPYPVVETSLLVETRVPVFAFGGGVNVNEALFHQYRQKIDDYRVSLMGRGDINIVVDDMGFTPEQMLRLEEAAGGEIIQLPAENSARTTLTNPLYRGPNMAWADQIGKMFQLLFESQLGQPLNAEAINCKRMIPILCETVLRTGMNIQPYVAEEVKRFLTDEMEPRPLPDFRSCK